MQYCVFDIETNGLLNEVSKIHCLSYRIFKRKIVIDSGSLTAYEDIINFINRQEILVGHNIIKYDIPVLKKILNIDVKATIIDTLGISYYHYPVSKFKHGLAAWGKRLGFGKPVVEDWKNQPIEIYIHRCESDVEINSRLFHKQMDYTMKIYDNQFDNVMRIFSYLSFKLECLRDQEKTGIDLDVRLAERSKLDLEFTIREKMNSLSANMPKELGKILYNKPKNPYKKDGSLSHYGTIWFQRLVDRNLPEDTEVIRDKPNPGSPIQLKKWLFGLDWKPKTFKLNDKGEKLPQVSLPFGAGLCPSVKSMFEEYPFLKDLNGLYKAKHRYGLFKSFLENKDESNKVYSTAHGFTNTLRMQHSKPIANLPGVNKWYGKEVRACLKRPNESYIMCGSDVSGLEDNTKQHYIYNYDPKYVEDMRVPGFDPHIDIGVLSGLLTKEEEKFYKKIEVLKDELGEKFEFDSEEDEGKFKRIKKIRGHAKTVNFSATYGAGPPKIAETLKCSLEFAKKLHHTYWKRNAAVKKTANACVVKMINNQKWLYNPVSGFWMFLKAEKDRFSTLNQSRICSV